MPTLKHKNEGGRRPGAGRKKGIPNAITKKRTDVAKKALEGGVTALEVMASTMRALWAEATDETGRVIDMEKAKDACVIADRCAKFMHPTLASVAVAGNVDHRFVAQMPAPAADADEWHNQYAPKTIQ